MLLKTYEFIRDNIHVLDIDFDNGVVNNRKEQLNSSGYYTVSLKHKRVSLHNVIAFMKYGEKAIGLVVNHIDGIKTNNNPDNLEVITQSKNLKHAFTIGLRKDTGENHWCSKLNNEKVKEIKQLFNDGMQLNKIAEVYGIDETTVSRAIKGKSWKHTQR